jgi:hypothetical protein
MINVGNCDRCSAPVLRTYRLSTRRKSLRLYCGVTCERTARRERAITARATYFWTKVAVGSANECWPWLGYRDPNRYGRYGRLLAHRISYLIARGPIAAGMCVCHSCDNPICVNPNHLWLGTVAANVADMDAKRRRVPGTRRGEASNKAKLTAPQALEIFQSHENWTRLAQRYGITRQSVVLIKKGVNWAHVTRGANAAA